MSRDPVTRFRAAKAFDEAPRDWMVSLFESAPEDADVVVVAPDVDAEGLPLDLDAPGRTLRAVSEQLSTSVVGRTIVVGAASGGVGCTSVAVHLAAFLSTDEPALYVESSPACGARFRLGLEHDGPDWSGVTEPDEIDERSVPIHAGFRALLAPDDMPLSDPVTRACRRRARHVVVDVGVVERPVVTSGDDDLFILVMSPTVPSARRAAALTAHLSAPPILLSNRLGPGSEITDRVLEEVAGQRIAVALPCSPVLRDAEDEGRILGPHASAWSRRVARLADRLAA